MSDLAGKVPFAVAGVAEEIAEASEPRRVFGGHNRKRQDRSEFGVWGRTVDARNVKA